MRFIKPKINTENKYDGILAWAIFIPVCALIVQLFLYKIKGVSESSSIHDMMMLICAIPMVASAFIWLKRPRNLKIALTIYAAVFAIFVFNYFVYPENKAYVVGYMFKVFLISIPMFINSALIKDESRELRILKIISWFIFIVGIAYSLFDILEKTYTGYSMSFGYYMLVPACFFTYLYFDSKKIRYLLADILTVSSILVLGSRGPLLVWASYFASFVFFSNISKARKLSIVGIVGVLAIFKDFIFQNIFLAFDAIGIRSRTLFLLLSGNISHDSGRSLIQAKCFEMIKENWFVGNGIGADLRVMGAGDYPHNIFIEIILQFGVIIGVLILAILIYASIRSFVRTSNKKLYFFYFCIGFLPLMISGTYLTSEFFWVFMGYIFRTGFKRATALEKPSQKNDPGREKVICNEKEIHL